MALKSILLALFLALLASMGWRLRQSGALQSLMPAVATRAKPVVFDNGTVRDTPAAWPSSAPGFAPIALHAMRKCQRGADIVYTDNPCKTGFREMPITRGAVTVLDGHSAPKATVHSQAPVPRATLHGVLDESGNDNLRAKRMERAINR